MDLLITNDLNLIRVKIRVNDNNIGNEKRGKQRKSPQILRFKDFSLAEKERFELSRRLSRPTPLAGAPLRPLEYFSVVSLPFFKACLMIIPYFRRFVNMFFALSQKRFYFSLIFFGLPRFPSIPYGSEKNAERIIGDV